MAGTPTRSHAWEGLRSLGCFQSLQACEDLWGKASVPGIHGSSEQMACSRDRRESGYRRCKAVSRGLELPLYACGSFMEMLQQSVGEGWTFLHLSFIVLWGKPVVRRNSWYMSKGSSRGATLLVAEETSGAGGLFRPRAVHALVNPSLFGLCCHVQLDFVWDFDKIMFSWLLGVEPQAQVY
mmetsp:Transcript_24999/g.39280  ORF Transcript_24999/g.39280 Transcript_24999/m.39280 type:complete len:181 (+) Transcript_24999:1325-1867(+)